MKILVFGAGAVGSTIGGMLAHAGHEVTLVGRDPHMTRIAASGLKITGLWGDHHVTTLTTSNSIPDVTPDWILLTVKAFDTEAAAKLLAQRFPKDIPVLHLQNGVGNAELLAQALGWPRVISGMIIIECAPASRAASMRPNPVAESTARSCSGVMAPNLGR